MQLKVWIQYSGGIEVHGKMSQLTKMHILNINKGTKFPNRDVDTLTRTVIIGNPQQEALNE